MCGQRERHMGLGACVLSLKAKLKAAKTKAGRIDSRERYLYKCAEEALKWIDQKTYGFALDVKDSLRVALRAYIKRRK